MNKNIIKVKELFDSVKMDEDVICSIGIYDDRIDACFLPYGRFFSTDGYYTHIYLNVKESDTGIRYNLSPMPKKDYISVPISTVYSQHSAKGTKQRNKIEEDTETFAEEWNEVMQGKYLIRASYPDISIVCKK